MSQTIPWQVQSLRLTTFLLDGVTLDLASLWTSVAGEGLDHEQHDRRTGESLQTGTFEGYGLQLRVLPGRVDWNLIVASEDPMDLSGSPFAVTFESMSRLGNAWLGQSHPAHRIAFGAILIQPVEDLLTGYQMIWGYLPGVEVEGDNISDFLYQINRPTESTVNVGSMINRLTKWSVARRRRGVMQMTSTQTSYMADTEAETYAARLEIDINTAPARAIQEELPQTERVFTEMMQLGEAIARRGDF